MTSTRRMSARAGVTTVALASAAGTAFGLAQRVNGPNSGSWLLAGLGGLLGGIVAVGAHVAVAALMGRRAFTLRAIVSVALTASASVLLGVAVGYAYDRPEATWTGINRLGMALGGCFSGAAVGALALVAGRVGRG